MSHAMPQIVTSMRTRGDEVFYVAQIKQSIQVDGIEIYFARAFATSRWYACFLLVDMIQKAIETCYHVSTEYGDVFVTSRFGPPVTITPWPN